MAEMWYYTTEGKQMDPVSMKELKRLVGDGTLKPTDMVWREGMARWIRASSVKELFPDPIAALDHYFSNAPPADKTAGSTTAVTPSTTAANAATPASTKPGAAPSAEEGARQKKRKPGSDDDDADARKPPRRRAETTSGGSSVGIIIGIVCALGLLFIACGGGLIIIIWVGQSGPGNGEPINGQVNYVAFIGPNSTDSRVFNFRKGVDYELKVTTQPREPDVDLFVINPADGRILAEDKRIDPDCLIPRFTPTQDGALRVEVKNLHNFLRVTSTVTIRELAPGQPPPPPDKDQKNPPKDELPPLPPDVFEKKGFMDITPAIQTGKDRVFKFRVRAGHKANFQVVPTAVGPNIDFNLFVNRDGGDNALLAADEGPAANASVDFTLEKTEIVRVRVVNASRAKGTNSKAKLFYDVSP